MYFAIPTFRRAEVLNKCSLKLLKDNAVDMTKVYIFIGGTDEVEDPQYNQKEEYEVFADEYGVNLVVNFTNGVAQNRNYMKEFFTDLASASNTNQEVIFIDDDIEKIRMSYEDNGKFKLKDLDDTNFLAMCEQGFQDCKKNGLRYWGINSSCNPMFMMGTDEQSTNLKLIQGGFNGEIFVPNTDPLASPINQFDDVYFTLKCFQRDGGVLRLNRYTLKTNKNWSRPGYRVKGGMNEQMGVAGRKIDAVASIEKLRNLFPEEMFKVKESKHDKTIQLNYRYKEKKDYPWDKLRVYIPSKGRKELKDFTIFGMNWKQLPFKLHFFVPHYEYEDYKWVIEAGANLISVPEEHLGLGRKKNYMLNIYPNDTIDYILMVDDDIKCLRNECDEDLSIKDVLSVIKKLSKTLEEREAYLGGITLCNNTFFMKNGISNTLKYICGGFQLHRLSNRSPISTEYRHFEDYVMCLEYFKRDGIICRINNITPITKNYNPEGGLCSDYGSLEARLKDAELVADKIIEEYPEGWVDKVFKKKSSRCPACWNLKLNYRAKF